MGCICGGRHDKMRIDAVGSLRPVRWRWIKPARGLLAEPVRLANLRRPGWRHGSLAWKGELLARVVQVLGKKLDCVDCVHDARDLGSRLLHTVVILPCVQALQSILS